MRRSLIAAAALGLLAIATPAWAASAKVNAGDDAIAWGSTELCRVYVDYIYEHKVNLWCADHGTAWVKVRVPGVDGHVTRVKANGDGDCSGKQITFTKRGNVVKVKITHTGVFDCTYTSVVVRYS